ncbi:hypothetical protein ACFP56_03660 [Paenibacillus septentrionalis]|uniref:Uncharacterized protein n=1 Tax=Paenibacillus septentrionalis TaxID=429342 RepID=A0ABW1UZ31_9BACL
MIGLSSSLTSLPTSEFQVFVFTLSSIKRYFLIEIVGGTAFFMLGRILFHSDLLCLACNIIASQMLNYVLPTATS